MNLYDMVKRQDQYLQLEGDISCCIYKPYEDNRPFFSVRMSSTSALRIKCVNEIREFSADSFDTGWRLYSDAPDGLMSRIDFEILIESDHLRHPINVYAAHSIPGETVVLNSESPDYLGSGDLLICNKSQANIFIAVCSVSTYKQYVIDLCRGKGVELGPGINPHITPSKVKDVMYIESKDSESWTKTYNASEKENVAIVDRDRYLFGDARDIEMLAAKDLDFIYSNHVIEHLLNPILVISKSLACLKPNGIFAGSVPSCANSFDLRQIPSKLDDLIDLEERDFRDVPVDYYQRWVLHTEPRTTVESLIRRSYSVHITFWSIELLRDLFDLLVERGLACDYEIMYEPNSKDIQFVLRSSGPILPI